MVTVLTHAERAAFKQCRRAWDLGASSRHNLEPMAVVEPLNVDRILRDALAVYYFPGMWDWSRSVVLPLVQQAFDKGAAQQRDRFGPDPPPGLAAQVGAARHLLGDYINWAPEAERLAPVLIEVDFDANLPDPDRPENALYTPGGESVRYQGRIDLLGVDQHDAYWIVRHRVVKDWTPLDVLLRDEEAVSACWAWEQFYLGMEITGTIHNEMRLPPRASPASSAPIDRPLAGVERGGLPQHEGSGGGRSIPQHRRLYAKANEPEATERVTHDLGPRFRRTYIRRTRREVDQAGLQLAIEARELLAPDVAVYPSPSELACRRCPFAAPCRALYEGQEAEAQAILNSSYQARIREPVAEGRLGGVTWSTGRGAAPPRFSSTES